MEKAWDGRFEKPTAESVESFSESISFDWRLYREDIEASIAHAEMLAECGLIAEGECLEIKEGLEEIRAKIESGEFLFRTEHEDIHMNIDAALIGMLGASGMKLHTARSRNDLVACDLRLWVRRRIDELDGLLADCQRALVRRAEDNSGLIVPGFTHLQHAQPLLLAHVLLAYVEMFKRDRDRLADCRRRTDVSPLGACALAGTSLPTDPEFTAGKLGFAAVFSNSVDAASDRDFAVELAFDVSLIAAHLSRLAEDWTLWASPEFDFIDLDEAYCTGSSIMPQKKNPDVLELIRGRCGRFYGHLMALLTLLKGQPLSYNRDMQEDKEPLFDAVDGMKDCLSILSELISRVTFKEDRMRAACHRGHLDATALAEYLVGRGVPFREAHKTVGNIVKKVGARGTELSELGLEELRGFSPFIAEDVRDVLGAQNAVARYRSHGSSAPAEVERQIRDWKRALDMQ